MLQNSNAMWANSNFRWFRMQEEWERKQQVKDNIPDGCAIMNSSQLLELKESEKEVSTFMTITHGKYPYLESQVGSLQSLISHIMTHLGLPHNVLLSPPTSSSMVVGELFLPFHSRSLDVMGTLSWVMEVPIEDVMLVCQIEEDKQETRTYISYFLICIVG
jgi:hypothetical protein